MTDEERGSKTSEEARERAKKRIAAWEGKPEHKAEKLDERDRQTIDDPVPERDGR